MLARHVAIAAIVLGCSSPTLEPQLWPGRPQRAHAPSAPWSLTASDGSGLALVRVEARAVVEGPLALTELHLYFKNPEPRTREGRFAIALPDRAAVSRFAMQIGDRLQEAEVVPTELARSAYEDFLHYRQDPALLEKRSGNEFSARVFPIPANAEKHLVLAFSQELVGEYVLPLRGLPAIDRVDIRVEAVRADGTRAVQELHERAWQPDRDFTVGVVGPTAVAAGGLVALHVTLGATATRGDAPAALTLLVDTSASRGLGFAAYLAGVGDLVQALRDRYGDVALTVAAYDQETEPIYSGPAAGFGAGELGELLERGAAGASDLGQAFAWCRDTGAPGRVVVVTDGVVTAGSEPAALVDTAAKVADRVDVVLAGGIRDERTAALLARAGKRPGDVHDLDRGASGVAIGLGEQVRTDVRVAIGGAAWVYPQTLAAVRAGSDPVTVYARLAAPAKTIEVRVDGEPRAVDLAAGTPALVERAFAGAEIAELEQRLLAATGDHAAALRADIAKRSVAARVVSSQAGMLVLERESDYVRFGIDRKALTDVLVVGSHGIAQLHRADVAVADAGESPDDDGGAAMTLDEGKMGKRDGQLARRQAIEQARSAGLLGARGGFGALTATADTTTGFDDTNVYGGLVGDRAGFGYGRTGFGPGGRGTGTGYGTIGRGSLRGRTSSPPTLAIGVAQAQGSLDKAIIRRYIKRNAAKLQYCYERRLLANPAIAGTVRAEFTIAPTGSVTAAAATGMDAEVARCVADVIREIEFPRPRDAGTVAVVYPFAFRWSGSDAPPPPAAPPARTGSVSHDGAPPLAGKLADVMAALRAHDAPRALAIARPWHAESPGDVLALVALGEALEASEDHAGAARAYGSIIDLYPARADLRRFAGERLERVAVHEPSARGLAIDTYRRAVADRPDHVTGHRLLAYALLRGGDRAGAFAAILAGYDRGVPTGRFAGAERVLAEDVGLIAAAYVSHGGDSKLAGAELARRNVALATTPSTRFVLYWETDANDVDFHIRDARGNEAWYANRGLASGGELYADITTGYGPECFTIAGAPAAGPYELSLHYYAQGPMGFGMGLLQIQRYDGKGELTFEDRPYVIMTDGAFVELGSAR